jgi:hypothetical protein
MINFRAILALSVLCAAPAFAEDRPYFWRTEISEDKNYLDFFTTTLESSFLFEDTRSNGATSSQSLSSGHQTSGFRWMSPRKNGLLIGLDGSYPSISAQGTVNSLSFNFKKDQTTYGFVTTQTHYSSYNYLNHNLFLAFEPNDNLKYQASAAFWRGSDGIGALNSSVTYDTETDDYDVLITGAIASSRNYTASTAWWITQANVYAGVLKRVKNWRFGPTVGAGVSDNKYIPNEFGAGLMGVYTSQNYEIRASLAHSVSRNYDIGGWDDGDRTADTVELTYVRALDNEWFLNLNVQNNQTQRRSQSPYDTSFYDETYKGKRWSVWVTKRF